MGGNGVSGWLDTEMNIIDLFLVVDGSCIRLFLVHYTFCLSTDQEVACRAVETQEVLQMQPNLPQV